MKTLIKEGDYIKLYLDNKRNWLLKVTKDKVFHTHKGVINLSNAIGKEWGSSIESNKGVKFYILKPTLSDFVLNVIRNTNIIYPKDAGLILLHSGIGPGSIVVEAGTGSGALTTVLAYYVRPTGHVYSYEIRKEFIEVAWKNIKRLSLEKYVTIYNKDVCEGIYEKEIDVVILDMATPWKVVPHAYESLKNGGVFISYSPTIEQVIKTVSALEESKGFKNVYTIECLLRDILVRPGKTRPSSRMIAHTGYLTFAQKVLREE
ncbi:MAG: tRNA (adenine-N1)-methyltransferase [Candidatus Asgardarchaeia archaeon]|nr:tRNA (adenine-N1)-methyltransferase [Candidatus Odinarchaeota archaeon]